MSEVLRELGQIRPEDVPPAAQGAVASLLLLRGDGPADPTTAIKDALFPGWRRYQGRKDLSPDLLPRYRVYCDIPQQVHLAEVLKPNIGHVEIVLKQPPQESEAQTVHPSMERLRNITSSHGAELAFAGFTAAIYGSVLIVNNAFAGAILRGYITQNPAVMNEAMLENYIGLGLIAAGAATAAIIGAVQSRK
ncbi:hypothetical protein HYS91_01950 [Candidatus Daviesbacteria bacterium]|nr:hypothetical protein [Candidatus Daviesbacteria bacterium]